MLEIIPFCLVLGAAVGAIVTLDIFAINEAKKSNLERPDFINLEED